MNSSSIIGSILIFLSLASGSVFGVTKTTPGGATNLSTSIDDDRLAKCLQSAETQYPFSTFNDASLRNIQKNLAIIYRENSTFQGDLDAGKHSLSDAIFGPVTRRWLSYFSKNIGIQASDPKLNKVAEDSLAQFANIAQTHPTWLKIMLSTKFEDWINLQPTPQRILQFNILRPGTDAQVSALIALYIKDTGAILAGETGALPGVEVTYRYDPKLFVVPNNIADISNRLKTMHGQPFYDKASFNEAVLNALNDNASTIPIDDDIISMIDKYSNSYAYQLTTETLVQLQRRGASQKLIERLTTIKCINFPDLEEFNAALKSIKGPESDSGELFGRKLHLIEDSRFQRYQIPERLKDLFADAGALSVQAAAVFSGLPKEVEYPTRALLDSALEWRVDVAFDMCPKNRNIGDQDYNTINQGRMADSEFVALEQVLGQPQYKKIEGFRNITQLCNADQILDSKSMSHKAYQILSAHLGGASMKTVNRVEAVTKETERKSDWAAPYCGCARDVSDGMIYGYYPLWNKAKPGKDQFNFGQLSRIGLVGMTADDEGKLVQPPGMTDNPIALIAAAHTHMTKVDWVIYKNDWRNWSSKNSTDKTDMLKKLKENIGKQLRKPLYTWDKQGTALASLGFDPAPTLGDGVTINFPNFPEEDLSFFNAFIKELSADLKEKKAPRQVNIMVSHSDMVDIAGAPAKIFGYLNLEKLIEETNKIEKETPLADKKEAKLADLRVLVLLAEHTIDSKKVLRSEIEYALGAAERQRLLRDIIPVIEYDGQSSKQLRDDIIYFADNFGGISFWSPIFVTPEDEEGADAEHTVSINRLLTLYYEHTDNLSGHWERLVSQMCAYRPWLRWAGWISLLLAASGAGAYVACCSCSERIKGNGHYLIGMCALMALPFAILFVLLLIDPLFRAVSGIFLVIYANAGLIGAVLVSRYYHLKSQRQIP